MPKRARLEPDGSPSNPSPAGMVLQDTTMAVAQDIFEPYPKIVFALGKAVQSKIPEKRLVDLQGHTGPVNTVEWCKADCSHLLLSSSMDRTVRVWDVIGDAKCVRTLTNHRAGVKMAAWTTDKKVLSCSFDKTAQLTDPQTGQTVTTFPHSNFVTVVRVHPQEHNLFLTGSTDIIQAWDSRTGKAVRDFKCKFGSVLDLAFFPSGKSFISSADVVARDSADKTIMVWDFNSGSKLSNQIFHERYSCPSVAVHPSEPNFIAQTNGDYIALFSTSRPYAMDKTVRFEGHKVQGYRIGCEFTPDGQMIVTGSGDGKVHFFNYYSGETARELNVYTNPCTDVKSHPVLSSTLATCSWGGQVSVWQ
ncbi:WDR25 [Branchiostoma lanceolatum]|uniref:WDR25 protein n=1 Tax=Branchiostoma lanceolatum TaxID=7740 RepID=A0A8S4MMD7_BRALA|nr:WDR25 [Branchiostoma lanceolatum]